jgi:hypothetical protein
MKVMKTAAWVVVVLVGIFFAVGFFLPSKWEVSRSILIPANSETIYAYTADLKKWSEWSVWTKKQDPSLVFTYEGPASGLDAQQNWTSDKMGKGWLKLVQANPETGLAYDLYIDMDKFQSTIHGRMVFEPKDNQTLVTWTDNGDSGNNILKKWMSLMMDSMLGKELETSLNNLKTIVSANTAVQ